MRKAGYVHPPDSSAGENIPHVHEVMMSAYTESSKGAEFWFYHFAEPLLKGLKAPDTLCVLRTNGLARAEMRSEPPAFSVKGAPWEAGATRGWGPAQGRPQRPPPPLLPSPVWNSDQSSSWTSDSRLAHIPRATANFKRAERSPPSKGTAMERTGVEGNTIRGASLELIILLLSPAVTRIPY